MSYFLFYLCPIKLFERHMQPPINGATKKNFYKMKTNETSSKSVKNSIDFTLVKIDNNEFKEQSIFRVLDFLNKKSKTVKASGLQKITIDDLKTLAPEYFIINVKDKKTGTVTQAPRKVFQAYTFLTAIRKQYGTK